MEDGDQVNFFEIIDRNACSTAVQAVIQGIPYTSTGVAKREPGDVFDPRVGGTLATARALRLLSRQMESQAMRLVREAEEDKRVRENAAAIRRTRLRGGLPRGQLSISDIALKYGPEAAEKARRRRLPRLRSVADYEPESRLLS